MKTIYKLSTSDASDIFFKDAKTETFTDYKEAYTAYKKAAYAGKIGNFREVKINEETGEEIYSGIPISL